MKHPRLSAIFLAASAASLLMASTAGFAHRENYKGEANFKAEVPPPCPPIMMLHDGFYIGAGVGYDAYKFHHRNVITIFDTPTPDIIDFSATASSNQSATGWMGGLFAGYGRYFDWMYLGLEINVSTSAADSTYNYMDTIGNSVSAKVKARASYGIGLLPGIKINDSTLLYARLAYLRTNFKGSATFSTLNPDAPGSYVLTPSNSEWLNGFNFGVGIESYVAEDVSIRGEFTHTSYSSKTATATFVDTTVVPSNTVIASSKFSPSNNEFMLSLLYHFAC